MKDNMQHQDSLSIQGQREYEDWKAELLSDPDDRAAFEKGVQQILRQQEQLAARESSSARRVTQSPPRRSPFSSPGVRPVFGMITKKRDD